MQLTTLLVAVQVGCALPAAGQSVDYPARDIRIVVPYPAGGGNDSIARMIASHLSKSLKRPVVVENRPGAAGTIGTAAVAKAPPDGYTLLSASLSHGMQQVMFKNVDYDVERDFAPVIMLGESTSLVLANPKRPYGSLKELIDYARANPGKVTVATAGLASSADLFVKLLKLRRIEVLGIPYAGSTPALTDTISGQVDVIVDPMSSSLRYAKSGHLNLLGVTSANRMSILPDIPTLAEVGLPGVDVVGWFGLFAPAGTPPAIIARLNEESARALKDAEVRARFEQIAVFPTGGSPEQLGAFVRAELSKWSELMQKLGLARE